MYVEMVSKDLFRNAWKSVQKVQTEWVRKRVWNKGLLETQLIQE